MKSLIGALRMTFAGMLKNPLAFFFGMLFIPVLLVVVSQFTMSGVVTPQITDFRIDYAITDQDHTEVSRALLQALRDPSMQGILVEDEDVEKATYHLEIPAGFGEKLLKQENPEIILNSKRNTPGGYAFFLQDLVEKQVRRIAQSMWLKDRAELALAVEKEEPPLIQVEQMSLDSVFHSRGYLAMLGMQMVFVVYVLNLAVSSRTLLEKTNLYLRINVSPQSKTWLYLQGWLTSSIQLFLSASIFLILMRLAFNGFAGNLMLHVLVTLVISLVVAAFASFLGLLLPPMVFFLGMYFLMIYQILFGATAIADRLVPSGILGKILGALRLRALYLAPYLDIAQERYQELWRLIPFVLVATSLLVLGSLVASKRKVV